MFINMRHKILTIIGISVLGGLFLSLMYINPFWGRITLSELILQLSGSRGEFPLGTSVTELIAFSMRMFPNNIFIIVFGTLMYKHFCTASVYVFTRQTNRITWYTKEVCYLALYTFIFQLVTASVAILVTIVQYDVIWNKSGFVLVAFHIALQSFWLYMLTLTMNIIAIKSGSNFAFLMVAGIQILCIALLGFLQIAENTSQNLIIMNPITRIILGWHSDPHQWFEDVLNPKYNVLFFSHSFIMLGVLAGIITIFGFYVIGKHDLLIEDTEVGVI
ncbi:MAG: hypothetical protein IKA09_11240 [Lachnospiraceae bacterium]|nr:hypothetical protein [Lachnospiraceae bacterium]